MSSVRTLFAQSFSYFLGSILVMLAGFVSFPLWTRVLNITDYGIFCTITITISFFTAFLKFGNQQSIVRYYYEYQKTEYERNIYYSTSILGAFFIGGIFAIILLVSIGVLPTSILNKKWETFLILAVFAGLSGSLIEIFLNFFRADQSIKTYNIIRISGRYGELGIAFVFVVLFSLGLNGLFIGQILSQILVLSLIIYLLVQKKGRVIKRKYFSLSFLKKVVKYGFPLIWLELANDVLAISDRYVIFYYRGAKDVAIYSAGYNVAQYCLAFFYRPLWLAVMPLYFKIWNDDGREKTETFLTTTLHYYLMIGIPIVFGISYMGRELITFLATSKYQSAHIIIPFVSMSYLLFGALSIVSAGIHIQKKTNILMYLSGTAAIMNIVLNILMVPLLGILGAAIVTLISYILLIVIVAAKASKFITVKINPISIVKCVILSVVVLFVISFYSNGNAIIELGAKIILGSLLYLIGLLFIDYHVRRIAVRVKDRTFMMMTRANKS